MPNARVDDALPARAVQQRCSTASPFLSIMLACARLERLWRPSKPPDTLPPPLLLPPLCTFQRIEAWLNCTVSGSQAEKVSVAAVLASAWTPPHMPVLGHVAGEDGAKERRRLGNKSQRVLLVASITHLPALATLRLTPLCSCWPPRLAGAAALSEGALLRA